VCACVSLLTRNRGETPLTLTNLCIWGAELSVTSRRLHLTI